MPTELTVIMRFEDDNPVPDRETLEDIFDAVVVEYEVEEV